MAESAAINKSLSVLGQVVHALNTGAVSDDVHLRTMYSIQPQSRIPYRNSKLTRILQDALGGQSVGLLICNLAPSMKFRQDTLNTLKCVSSYKSCMSCPDRGLVLPCGQRMWRTDQLSTKRTLVPHLNPILRQLQLNLLVDQRLIFQHWPMGLYLRCRCQQLLESTRSLHLSHLCQ